MGANDVNGTNIVKVWSGVLVWCEQDDDGTGRNGIYTGELLKAINLRKRPVTPVDLAHIINSYDAELRSADAAFGALLEGLKERGLYDESLIILTSDHGEEFGEHGITGWHSHTLYDEQLLVPLIVKLPDSRRAGTRVDSQVRGIDIAPSILAAVGIARPVDYRGVDLLSATLTQARPDLPAFSMLDGTRDPIKWSIRHDGWKLFGATPPTLYHLTDDASERVNVAVTHSQQAARLQQLGRELMQEVEVPKLEPADPTERTVEALRSLGYLE